MSAGVRTLTIAAISQAGRLAVSQRHIETIGVTRAAGGQHQITIGRVALAAEFALRVGQPQRVAGFDLLRQPAIRRRPAGSAR